METKTIKFFKFCDHRDRYQLTKFSFPKALKPYLFRREMFEAGRHRDGYHFKQSSVNHHPLTEFKLTP